MIKRLIIFLFFAFFAYIIYMAYKYNSPCKFIMIWGKKRSGKTTLLQKFAIQYQKKGYTCFSNVELFGCYHFDPKDFGHKQLPRHSVLLIDEISLLYDSRNFKSFDLAISNYVRLLGHKDNIVICASQTWDIDKRLRDLTDELYLCVKFLSVFSVAKRIKKVPTLHKPLQLENGSSAGEGFISEDFKYYPPTMWKFTFIPRWAPFFNSFDDTPLPAVPRKIWKFNNFAELYKLKRWTYYKRHQIITLYQKAKKEAHALRFSFQGEIRTQLLNRDLSFKSRRGKPPKYLPTE